MFMHIFFLLSKNLMKWPKPAMCFWLLPCLSLALIFRPIGSYRIHKPLKAADNSLVYSQRWLKRLVTVHLSKSYSKERNGVFIGNYFILMYETLTMTVIKCLQNKAHFFHSLLNHLQNPELLPLHVTAYVNQ